MTKKYSLLALLFAAILPLVSHAGTPLICHPYNIGEAKSLPAGNWKGCDPKYDRSQLVNDTLALLTAETPVLVRMETLRRAAIYTTGNLRGWDGGSYTTDDRRIANGLLGKLRERTQQATDSTRALALFDLGFFSETLRRTDLDPSLDGYAFLTKAAELRPGDADIQFALAVASAYPDRKSVHAAHLSQARAGAKADTLLAANLRSHFQH
jgi:hypothetical protein